MTRRDEIEANLQNVRAKIESLNPKAKLIVVTKTFPLSDLEILYELGEREFGENRDQEATEKVKQLPGDINWHFQGQIQSNKIKSIANWANVIHSIDEEKQITKFAESGKKLELFLQVNLQANLSTAGNEMNADNARGGANPKDLTQLAELVNKFPNLHLLGLMAVAPLDEAPDQAFGRLSQIFKSFQQSFPKAQYLSAGMSFDFESALNHGATHVRIGSSILGKRE